MPVVKPGTSELSEEESVPQVLPGTDAFAQYNQDMQEKLDKALGAKPQNTATTKPEPPEDFLADVSEEDKKVYLRSLMAGEPFAKGYNLFGGALTVAFRSRTVGENEKLRQYTDTREYNKHAIALSIESLDIRGHDSATMVTAAALNEMNDIVYAALVQAFRKFEELCDTLFKAADNPNFWSGIAGHV